MPEAAQSPSPAAHPMREWLYRVVPALDSLRGYTSVDLRRDVFAGATVAAVAVPQAMAYASIFGMPVQHGLYTAIVMTAVGAMFDSSKQLINGPTNAVSIAMLSALAVVPSDARISAAILMAFLIGLFQSSISLLRLGDLSRYVSHAVIVGFTAGASILLIMDQLKNILGLQAVGDAHDHFIKRFWLTMSEGGSVSLPTLAVAMLTIFVALSIDAANRRFRLGLPALLLAMIAASGAVYYLNLAESGVRLIDPVPRSLPIFELPRFDWILTRELAGSAVAIGLLGLLEATAMAKSIAARTGQKLDMNQQCLSEGLANMGGSFFQCFPGSGSLTRSYINHLAGAATQWSGVVSALLVAAALMGFAPMAQYIPRASLAGVLVLAGARMVDLPSLFYHCRTTRFDAIIVLATALSAVLISIEFCILIGTFLSFILYVPRAARVECIELTMGEGGAIHERSTQLVPCPLLKIYDFEGELFFGSAPEFEGHLDRIKHETSDCRALVLRMKYLRNPDAVCLQLLLTFLEDLRNRGIQVCISGVRSSFYETLERAGVVDRVGADRVFRERPDVWSSTTAAVAWAYSQLGDERCHACPRILSASAKSWSPVI